MSKVKICGLCRMEDIEAVNDALPDYAGFVFAPGRRQIARKMAEKCRERMDSRIQSVGVFVNGDVGFITELYRDGIIGLAQLHGDEDADYVRRLRDRCGCQIVKAVSVGSALPPLLPADCADYLLFDTLADVRGGSGRSFDWDVLKDFHESPYFLAGGITASNVGKAINLLRPYCVDVSGGVETGGVKDSEKIHEFVNTVRRETDGKR